MQRYDATEAFHRRKLQVNITLFWLNYRGSTIYLCFLEKEIKKTPHLIINNLLFLKLDLDWVLELTTKEIPGPDEETRGEQQI